MTELGTALAWYLVFVLSVTCHEAAHAWTAKLGGDPTAYHGGQVTLDPLPHMRREPFGMVVLPLLTTLVTGWPIGFASAPYDLGWARRHRRRAALMALAGPVSNLLLALLAGVAIRLGLASGSFTVPEFVEFGNVVAAAHGGPSLGTMLLGMFLAMNLLLFALNILPLPPLDGSGVLPFFLGEELANRYSDAIANPAVSMLGLVAAWFLIHRLFEPVFLWSINAVYVGITSYGRARALHARIASVARQGVTTTPTAWVVLIPVPHEVCGFVR